MGAVCGICMALSVIAEELISKAKTQINPRFMESNKIMEENKTTIVQKLLNQVLHSVVL